MKDVITTAKNFLIQNQKEDPEDWKDLELIENVKENIGYFWWNSELKLADIPLVNKYTKERSGYLLVSESEELPPVIEYATNGLSLTEQINQLTKPILITSGIEGEITKYHFITSTEIYAEISRSESKDSFLLNVPDLFTIPEKSILSYNRTASSVFDPQEVKTQWEAFTPGNPGNKPKVVLNNAKPTRYQQNCNSYNFGEVCSIDSSITSTYCSPRRIAGCVPVAWAMLLSSWKRTGYWDTNKIWKNSACWNIEWPSWGGTWNPSQCDAVESSIWKLHTLMSTTADGSTTASNVIKGAKIFSSFNMTWKFHRASNQKFDFARKIISAGQPFVFDGQGKWSFTNNVFSDTPGPGKTGHAVVAYGYKKSNKTLLVALGWGNSFENKWINHDQFGGRGYSYLTKLRFVDGDNSEEILEI